MAPRRPKSTATIHARLVPGSGLQDGEIRTRSNARARATSAWPRPRCGTVAGMLAEGVVGWFQGRMEFGPRALGARSIIGDPRNSKMQSVMNLKIKYRESFRPFAPAVLASGRGIFRARLPQPVHAPGRQRARGTAQSDDATSSTSCSVSTSSTSRARVSRRLPTSTIRRGSRLSTRDQSALLRIARAFDARTGCAVLVNTSFNVRGEPIVCTPEDAYRCFMRTEMDELVLGDFCSPRPTNPSSRATTAGRRSSSWTDDRRWSPGQGAATESGVAQFGLSAGGAVRRPVRRAAPAAPSTPAQWPWILAAVLWVAALAWPRSLTLLHRGWTRLGHALGWFNTRVILTLIFMIVITPFSFVMWVFGRDRMKRGFDPKGETYRVPSPPRPPQGMEKPF